MDNDLRVRYSELGMSWYRETSINITYLAANTGRKEAYYDQNGKKRYQVVVSKSTARKLIRPFIENNCSEEIDTVERYLENNYPGSVFRKIFMEELGYERS